MIRRFSDHLLKGKMLAALSLAMVIASACAPATAPTAVPPPQDFMMYVNVGETDTYMKVLAPLVKIQLNANLLVQEKNSLQEATAMLAQKDNPEASLACSVAGGDIAAGLAAGVYAKLDYTRLPNSKDLFKIATEKPLGDYGVALYASGIMIQYYAPVFDKNGWAPPTMLTDLADPKYKGHVGLTSTRSGIGVMFLDLISKAAGAPTGDVTPGIEYAKKLVAAGQVQSFPGSSAEVNTLMQNGEIWIADQSGPGGMKFASTNPAIKLVTPKGGAYILPQGCVIPAKAPKMDLAYQVLNLALGDAFQTAVAVNLFSDPMRPVTLPADIGAMLPHTAADFASLKQPNGDEWAQFRPAWHDRWLKEVEAAK